MMMAGAIAMTANLYSINTKHPVSVLTWEPGQGKTFIYVLTACYAIRKEKARVLFVTHNEICCN